MAEAVDGLLEEHAITGIAYAKHPQNEAFGFTADDLTERSTRLGAAEPDLRPLTELIAALAQILAIDPLERPAADILWPAPAATSGKRGGESIPVEVQYPAYAGADDRILNRTLGQRPRVARGALAINARGAAEPWRDRA